MKKNRIRICGRNTSTLPAPEITPPTIRLRSGPAAISCCTACPKACMPALIQATGAWAQLNTAWNTRNISSASSTGPAIGCITIASSRASARSRNGST